MRVKVTRIRGRGARPGSLCLPPIAAHWLPGRACRFSGPNSSTEKTTSGSPWPGAAARSAIAHNCSTLASCDVGARPAAAVVSTATAIVPLPDADGFGLRPDPLQAKTPADLARAAPVLPLGGRARCGRSRAARHGRGHRRSAPHSTPQRCRGSRRDRHHRWMRRQ